MSFTLEITFKCLCFFVADTRNGAPTMHVLMPDTGAHHGGIDEHAARLVFPKPGGRLALDENQQLIEVNDGSGIADFQDLKGFRLQLGAPGITLQPAIPAEVASVSSPGSRVRTDLLDQPAPAGVASRVVLTSGSFTYQHSPAVWSFRNPEQALAQEVVWTIPDMPGDALTMQLTPLNGNEPVQIGPIPANEDGLVSISIQHITATQFPTPTGDPAPNTNAAHFDVYYDYLDPPPAARTIPTFVRRREGRTITCLTGTGEI